MPCLIFFLGSNISSFSSCLSSFSIFLISLISKIFGFLCSVIIMPRFQFSGSCFYVHMFISLCNVCTSLSPLFIRWAAILCDSSALLFFNSFIAFRSSSSVPRSQIHSCSYLDFGKTSLYLTVLS